MNARSGRRFAGWTMVLLCFLCQNAAIGFAFNSFGPLLVSSEQHFGITRTTATLGMSAIMLALGGLAPVLGGLLQKVPLRAAMMGGALLSAAGYTGLALASSFGVALAMYAMIGAGSCLLGILGPLALINRWFTADRAKILGVVNLPVAHFLAPLIIAECLPSAGRFGILAGIAGLFLLLVPLLLLVIETPASIGQAPHGGVAGSPGGDGKGTSLSTRAIIANPDFWLLSIPIGVMAGSGAAFAVHVVPFGTGRGLSLIDASWLLSTFAGAGMIGTLLFGWVADRIGTAATLVINTGCQALLWLAVLQLDGFALLLAAAGLLGICAVPTVMLHGAALSELFGAVSVSRAMGLSYLVKLPFLFAFAPMIGRLFDASGSYGLPFMTTSAMLAAACALLIILARRRRRGAAETDAGAQGRDYA
jgi:sugar phosphate permease